MGPRLGHRVIGVGGGEQASGRRERRGGQSSVIARAIESLMVGGSDWRQRGKKR